MKKLLIIGITVLLIGLIFRFLHFPGGAILLLTGNALILIHSLIFLVQNSKKNITQSFFYFSFSFISIYSFFRLQFWPTGPFILGISLFSWFVFSVTFTYFILFLSEKNKFRLPQLILVAYFLFYINLGYTHSHSIYNVLYFNSVINSESIKTNYRAWVKYSWFLYISDKQNEALEANQKAQDIINQNKYFDDDLANDLWRIQQHEEKIRNQNWMSYP